MILIWHMENIEKHVVIRLKNHIYELLAESNESNPHVKCAYVSVFVCMCVYVLCVYFTYVILDIIDSIEMQILLKWILPYSLTVCNFLNKIY